MKIQPRSERVAALVEGQFNWTDRQRDVLSLLAKGRSNQEIADELGISLDGAKWHLREILSKLGVDSREEAADYWRARNGVRGRARLLGATVLANWKLVAAGAAVAAVAGTIAATALWRQGNEVPSQASPPVSATATNTPSATLRAGPTPILTPGPRPTPRSDCFPGGCTSSIDGPPATAPPGTEWVMDWISRLEATDIRVAEIRRSHLESFIPDRSGLNAAWLATNLGILELMELPGDVFAEQVTVVTEPIACSPPAASCRDGWRYTVTIGTLKPISMAGTALTLEEQPIQFVVGSGLFGLAWSETLAARAAEALNGRRLR